MRRLLLLIAFLTCMGPAARAQVEIYGTLAIPHFSQVPTGFVASGVGFQEQYTSFTTVGVGGGVSVKVASMPFVAVSLDVRGMTRPAPDRTVQSKSYTTDSALFGVKLGSKKPIGRLKPYVEGAIGFASVRTPNISSPASGDTTTDNEFASHYTIYEVIGGVDYRLAHFVDLRLIEVGGGSSFKSSPNTSLWTVNTGVVLHF